VCPPNSRDPLMPASHPDQPVEGTATNSQPYLVTSPAAVVSADIFHPALGCMQQQGQGLAKTGRHVPGGSQRGYWLSAGLEARLPPQRTILALTGG
jgi:hypothetical protein